MNTEILYGLLTYFLLCTLSVFVGFGLLRLSRLPVPRAVQPFFAPVFAYVFWVLALGITGGLKIPVKFSTPVLWIISFLLIGVGVPLVRVQLHALRQYRDRRATAQADSFDSLEQDQRFAQLPVWSSWVLLGACMLIPIGAMMRYFAHGLRDYLGTMHPDAWAYAAIGQYVWEYPRGTEGGLAPLYQYGTNFITSRYISFSLLGFFSPLTRWGDTQASSSLMQAWVLFGTACAVALFWAANRSPRWIIILGALLSVVAGWVGIILWNGNYDNLVTLLYLPTFAAIISLFQVRKPPLWIALGVVAAATIYTYIELAPAILGAAVLLILPRLWVERKALRPILYGIAIGIAIISLLILPFITDLISYFSYQLAFAQRTAGPRPGGDILSAMLISTYHPAAFWGLGSESGITTHYRLRNIAALCLIILSIVGLASLIKQRQWGVVLAVVSFTATACYYLAAQHYAYGAYKLINIEWWMLITALLAGVSAVTSLIAAHPKILANTLFSAFLCAVIIPPVNNISNVENPWHWAGNDANGYLLTKPYRQIEEIKPIIQNDSTLVMVDDFIANEWAVYYLRNVPIILGAYRQYMSYPEYLPAMRRAALIDPATVRYVLTDATFTAPSPNWKMAWQGSMYRLWQPDTEKWTLINAVTGANGAAIGRTTGASLATPASTLSLRIWSGYEGTAFVGIGYKAGTPISTETAGKLRVTSDLGHEESVTITPGRQLIPIAIRSGETVVTISSIPSTPRMAGGPISKAIEITQVSVAPDKTEALSAITVAQPTLFTLDVTFPARSAGLLEPLITTGQAEAGDFIGVRQLSDDEAVFGFVHWGANPVEGPPIAIEPGHVYRVTINMDRVTNTLSILVDNKEALRIATTFHPTTMEQITVGENRIGGVGAPSAEFSGTITVVDQR